MRRGIGFKLGVGIIIFLAIVVITSFFWTPYDPNQMSVLEKFSPPGPEHWMGTDNFGRDILSRVMEGLRTTFVVAVTTVLIGLVIGIVLGAFTGYFGGWIDEVLMRINDAVAAFPSVLLALVIISILGTGKYRVIIALGIVFIPSFARITRSEYISYKHRDYVKSAKLMGAGQLRIMFIHILPNAVPTLFSAVIIGLNNAVLAESSMSYLGLGVQPPDASLGKMLSESQGFLTMAPWYSFFPALVVILLVLGFVLIGTGVQEESVHPVELSESSLESGKDIKHHKVKNPLLAVSNLCITFDEKPVVDHVNFEIGKKEIVGIVGESGSGKTMTALGIAGLLPKEAKSSGEILIHKQDIRKMKGAEARAYKGDVVSMIFQEPMTSLNPVIKVGKQIEEMLKLHTNLNKKDRKARVLEAMNMVELSNPEELYDKYPHQLSGGMRQRVMIAIAMICNPEILIADEPTTALDAQVQKQILELLQKLNREHDTAILFISHNLNVIKEICDRVLVMNNGKIVEEGEVQAVFDHPNHDYTKKLIDSTIINIKNPHELGKSNILELRDLSIYYEENRKKRYIINDLNLDIKEGEILGVTGPSGCGKTTLSKVILGLHKGYEGQINHSTKNPQMIFQDPYSSLNPSKKIGWILAEPLRIQNPGRENNQENEAKVREMLKEVGLSQEIYHRYPRELSGGQRQRVSIAAALIGGAKFVIADEPVSALDVTIGKQVIDLLLKLQREYGLTILFISHDQDVIDSVSDRVLSF